MSKIMNVQNANKNASAVIIMNNVKNVALIQEIKIKIVNVIQDIMKIKKFIVNNATINVQNVKILTSVLIVFLLQEIYYKIANVKVAFMKFPQIKINIV